MKQRPLSRNLWLGLVALLVFATPGCDSLSLPEDLAAVGDDQALTIAAEPAAGLEAVLAQGLPAGNGTPGALGVRLEAAVSQWQQTQGATVVRPGMSIQAAVEGAAPGTIILIQPGVYHEAVSINTPGLKLIGLGHGPHGVVLQRPDGMHEYAAAPGHALHHDHHDYGPYANGIDVGEHGDGVVIANLTVRDFDENGVYLDGVEGFYLARITAIDSGEYGVYPVRSQRGVIFRCTASGHTDAGIYVGQSEDVAILQSEAYGNVIGFEVENASRIAVRHNRGYQNTAGLLAVLLPGLPVTTSEELYITQNQFWDNNTANFADPGALAAAVPRGSGILIVGPDNTVAEQNRVWNNDFTGIAVGSITTLGALAGLPPEAFAGIDPDPDGTQVIKNRVTGNGGNPPDFPPPIVLPGVDLLWDGTGAANCWLKNHYDTSAPETLPSCSTF